jgi:hypothetical protein
MAAFSSAAAEAVIFSINSAIKLSQNLRRAYAQSLRGRALTLPLPEFNSEVKMSTIDRFFDEFPEYPAGLEPLKNLHNKSNGGDELTEEDQNNYREFYFSFKALERGENGQRLEMSAEDLTAFFKVRQWDKGKAPQSVLQLVAGTLVDIGIDYFSQQPGLLNPESVHGKVMYHFLRAFDDIDFAEQRDFKEAFSARLVPKLFAAAAESVADLAPDLAGDPKVQSLIHATAKGIATDIYRRAETLGTDGQNEAVHWGQMVLRSMVGHAGQYVVQSPQSLFGTNQGVSKIIESTGVILLEVILDDDSDQIVFKNALSPDTLDRLTSATLDIVAQHPSILHGGRGIKEIIAGVAGAVKDKSILERGFLPELTRVVLEQSAGRLDLLWRETPTGAEHLLVSAVKQVMGALAAETADGKPWKPALNNTQMLSIVEELVDEVVQNPAWILDEVQGKPVLSEMLDATFGAMRNLPKDARLQGDVLRSILKLNVETTLLHRSVLDKIKWGTEQEEKAILSKALEMVFTFVFPQNARPEIGRLQLLAELLEYVTQSLLRQHPNENGLILLDLVLFKGGVDFSRGFDKKLADEILQSVSGALAAHPELLVKDALLRNIVSDLAQVVQESGIRQPGLLPELIRITLENVAAHLEAVADEHAGQPKHILVLAIGQVLRAITQPSEDGRWTPKLSNEQIQEIVRMAVAAVLENPQWVRGGDRLFQLIDAVICAMERLPEFVAISYALLRDLLEIAMEAVERQGQLLNDIKTETGETIIRLRFALEELFAMLAEAETAEELDWYLSQRHILNILLEYFLTYIVTIQATEDNLNNAVTQMKAAVALWREDTSKTLEDVFGKLGKLPV